MRKMDLSSISKGETVRGALAIKEATIRTASNGNYLQLTLTDGELDIVGKQWQYTLSDVPQMDRPIVVVATVGEFRDKLDLNIKRLHPVSEADGVSLRDFSKGSAIDPKELYDQAFRLLESIEDKPLRTLAMAIYSDHEQQIIATPAGVKNHHDFIGGFLEHSLEVTRFALALGERYDQDLIKAGGLLHDIGKIFCYRWEGVAIEYTDAGHWEDHIPIGYRLIHKYAEDHHIAQVVLSKLAHIVLAHHGEMAWGSPVEAVCPEAYAVHLGDMASSRFSMFDKAKKESKEEERWSERIWPLNRRVYVGE